MKKGIKRAVACIILLVFFGCILYFFFPGIIIETGIRVLRWEGGLERKELVVEKNRWVYLENERGGETILFIHGFGSNKDHWGRFLHNFSNSYHIVVPDLPGFGESSKKASASYDIPSQVKRLRAFVNAMGLATCHMVGVSMGGYISGYYASEFPDSVEKLVLMDSAGVEAPVSSKAWKTFHDKGKNLLLYKNTDELEKFMEILFYEPPWVPRRFKDYFARKGAVRYSFWNKIVQDLLEGGMFLLEDRLQNIRAETLIIWGSDDRIIDVSSVEKFRTGINDSRVVVLDDCGHVPFLERSESTVEACMELLNARQQGS